MAKNSQQLTTFQPFLAYFFSFFALSTTFMCTLNSKYTSNLLTHMGRYFFHYHYQPNNNPHVNWKIGQNTHHAIVPDTFMTHPGVIPGLGGSKNSSKNTPNRSHFFGCFDQFKNVKRIIIISSSSQELNFADFPFYRNLSSPP